MRPTLSRVCLDIGRTWRVGIAALAASVLIGCSAGPVTTGTTSPVPTCHAPLRSVADLRACRGSYRAVEVVNPANEPVDLEAWSIIVPSRDPGEIVRQLA